MQDRRQYMRDYQERRREANRIPPEDLQAFVNNPLEEKRRGWPDVIVCRICGLKTKMLSNHLRTENVEELSNGLPNASVKERCQEYRRRFGYNKNAPLVCESLRLRFARATTQRNRKYRHQGRAVPGQRTRFQPGRSPTDAATQARREYGTSRQTSMRLSESLRGRPLPKKWKTDLSGKTVSDWQVAKLRLEGYETADIAAKVQPPLTRLTIKARLDRMGFPPGNPCRFYRGAPVTEKNLLAHYEDLKSIRMLRNITRGATNNGATPATLAQIAALLRTSAAWIREQTRPERKNPIPHSKSGRFLMFHVDQVVKWCSTQKSGRTRFFSTLPIERELALRLGVGRHRIYDFVRPGGQRHPLDKRRFRRTNHPLSIKLAVALLSSIESLRQDRRLGTTPRGGRPRALLPSEQKYLLHKHQDLKSDLNLMLRWAERQSGAIALDTVGEWMCEQSRLGKLRVLLFWSTVHQDLPRLCTRVRDRRGGPLGPSEAASALLCREYGISNRALKRLIRKVPPRASAA